MAKLEHKDIPVGENSAHPPGYVQEGDPGAVGAYKVWVKLSTAETRIRNAANAAWILLGTAGAATAIIEASGPDTLAIDAIADGDYLRRSGSTIVGDTPAGGGGGSELPIDAAATAAVGSGDLFPGTSLDGGWSSLQTTPVTSVDRSVAGYCILKNTGNTGGQERGLKRTFSPAGDFEVYTCVPSSTFGQTLMIAGGVFIGATDPSDGAGANRLHFYVYSNGGNVLLYAAKVAAGVQTQIIGDIVTTTVNFGAPIRPAATAYPFPLWLCIKRVGANLSFGVSWDGVQFRFSATTTTIAYTVNTCGLLIGEATATQDIQSVFKYIATVG